MRLSTDPVRLVALVAALGLVVAACAGDDPPSPTTTTGSALPPRTTLPPVVTTAPTASTTTTVPAQIATVVDACALVAPEEVQPVADEPGPGAPVPLGDRPGSAGTDGPESPESDGAGDEPGGPPALLLSGCAWPTDGTPLVTLSYLAPTTAGSALEHLQRLVDLDARFARGARVFPLQEVDGLGPAALLDGSGGVIEVAVVAGSALLYVVPREAPASGTPEADALVGLLMAAAARAPG